MDDGLAGKWIGHAGIEMHDTAQLDRLAKWRSYSDLFESLRLDPAINPNALGSGYVENNWFHTPDVEIYAAMIRDDEPELIVEIGGGFTTLIARKTLDALGLTSARLIVIDPEPRLDVRRVADELVLSRVEDVDLEAFPRVESMLLFIDSSHVTAIGGDVPFLYNTVVPNLPSGSLVQAHDIFIPFDYRPDYHERGYTEQYVLQALLSGSSAYSVEFATVFMSWRYPQEMRATFGGTVPGRHAGASLWFRT